MTLSVSFFYIISYIIIFLNSTSFFSVVKWDRYVLMFNMYKQIQGGVK